MTTHDLAREGEVLARERSRPASGVARVAWRTALVVLLCLVAAEITARLEDLVFDGVPLTANPTPDSQLIYTDPDGVTRGRPGGRYGQWHLNQFGFRGPDISVEPKAGTTRVMVLGSSEAFGLYEPDGKEFPRQLGTQLSSHGAFEVVNASLFGMTLRSMVPFWRGWASRFRPQVVVIYPSPLFYLQDAILSHRQPAGPQSEPRASSPSPAPPKSQHWQSRFVDRLRDVIDLPDVIQRRRDDRQIGALTANKPPGWLFTTAPADRVQLFAEDLSRLIEELRAAGVTVVLATHAFRCSTPPTTEDIDVLNRSRVHSPRATPLAIHEFHGAVNGVITRVGADQGVIVVDADAVLSGKPENFGDLIHFTEKGSVVMAALLAQQLRSAPEARMPARDADAEDAARPRSNAPSAVHGS